MSSTHDAQQQDGQRDTNAARPSQSAAYYDELQRGAWKHVTDFGPSIQSRYRVIRRLLRRYAPLDAAVHDVGCGSGNLLEQVQRLGYQRLSGSDFSPEALHSARGRFSGELTLVDLTQANAIPHGTQYDVLLCSEVLEHIDQDERAIENIASMLHDGGTLILSVPYRMKYWSAHDSFSGHVRRYEPGELEGKLEAAGCAIRESFGWGTVFYALYHEILRRSPPQSMMAREHVVKRILAKCANLAFMIDDFFPARTRGRRLFVVAQKHRAA